MQIARAGMLLAQHHEAEPPVRSTKQGSLTLMRERRQTGPLSIAAAVRNSTGVQRLLMVSRLMMGWHAGRHQ